MSEVIIVKTEVLKALIRSELESVVRTSFAVATTSRVEEDIFMNVTEAAAFLHKKPSTIYRHVWKRELPCYKRSNRLLFKKQELLSWIETGMRRTNDEIQSMVKNR